MVLLLRSLEGFMHGSMLLVLSHLTILLYVLIMETESATMDIIPRTCLVLLFLHVLGLFGGATHGDLLKVDREWITSCSERTRLCHVNLRDLITLLLLGVLLHWGRLFDSNRLVATLGSKAWKICHMLNRLLRLDSLSFRRITSSLLRHLLLALVKHRIVIGVSHLTRTIMARLIVEAFSLMSVRQGLVRLSLSWDTTLLSSLSERLGKSLRVVLLGLELGEGPSAHGVLLLCAIKPVEVSFLTILINREHLLLPDRHL